MNNPSRKIPYQCIVNEDKKEVYFNLNYPSTLILKSAMKKYFPDDYKGYIASKEMKRNWKNNQLYY
tara:strand:+ start:237 stop:434 length:198 start_codon:yes stop_codon:yes gene_type:complete